MTEEDVSAKSFKVHLVKKNLLRCIKASVVGEVDCGWWKTDLLRRLEGGTSAEIPKNAKKEETSDNLVEVTDQKAIDTYHSFFGYDSGRPETSV